jgi:hypothetical protein
LLKRFASRLSDIRQANLERNRMLCLKRDIEEAKRDWQYACLYFNVVTEPELIDHAIHMMHAAEVRYGYMLKQLKSKNA